MKLINLFCLAILITFMSSCNLDKCDFEFGTRGVIKKFANGPENGGEYYVGDASSFAAHSVITTNDPEIDLEDLHQSGEKFVLHCTYIKEQAADGALTPPIVNVIHVHEESFVDE